MWIASVFPQYPCANRVSHQDRRPVLRSRLGLWLVLCCISVCALPQNGTAQTEWTRDTALDSLLSIKISTAAKYEQTTREAPASVTLITSEDIERYGYHTLVDVFRHVRGFYISDDRNYSYLGARGFSRPTDYNNRMLLLVNGHSINETIFGSAPMGTDFGIDLGSVERIEIVRGPGSALYGTGAMFTVINIMTKSGATIDGFHLAAETGSYGRVHGSVTFGKETANGLGIMLSGMGTDIKGQDLYYKEYDTSSTNHGIARGLDRDRFYGALTTITYDKLTVQGALMSRTKGIPTGAFDIVFNDASARTLDEWKFLELKYDSGVRSNKNVMLRGYVDHYGYSGTYPYTIMTFESGTGNWAGGELRFRWDLTPSNRLIVGTEYKEHLRAAYRYWSTDATYFNGNFPFHILSFYLQEHYQVTENLSLRFGLRRDDYSTVGSSTTPRGALIYNPTKSSTLKLLYGEGFRAPNVYEANYDDPLTGFKSNPALRPEKIRTVEGVWEQRLSDQLFGIASLYNYTMNNLIDTKRDPSDSLLQYQNVMKIKATGVELELNARFNMGLRGYASYSLQHPVDTESKTHLTNSPSHLLKIGLTYPFMQHWFAAAELQYESPRKTVYDTRTDAYLLTTVHLTSKPLWHRIVPSLLVDNVFNVTYKTPGGFEHKQDGITQNGRNWAVKLEYQL